MAANHVNYDLFRVLVYAPDGVFIKEAGINNLHQFYCSGLVPGQNYNIVFTYDGALLLCLSFTCNERGRVILINQAHILYNCALVRPGYGFISILLEMIRDGEEMEIVGLGFEKRLLEILRMSGTVNVSYYFSQYGFYMFKAGDDLHSNFLQNQIIK